MNATELLNQLRSLFGRLAAPIGRWIQGHALLFLACGVVVLFVSYGWAAYTDWRTKPITFYTGPLGGSLADPAGRIADRINEASTLLGTQYRVSVTPTNGYEDNRYRVSHDKTGSAIGFAHDGFGDSSNIAILLPLEHSYLHILCRQELATKLAGTSPAPLMLGQLKDNLRAGHVYLGPPQSGTRQTAEIILKSHGLVPDKLATHGVADWNEMRAGLANGHIDAAFYSGPIGAEIIAKIASDNSCRLIGLGAERAAILQENPQIAPAQFQSNSYGAAGFCPTTADTVATRRVLICPRTLPDKDAYILAKAASEAVQLDAGAIVWKSGPPTTQQIDERFSYILHPGAVLLRDQKPPSLWIRGGSVFLWTVIVWAITEFVRSINSWLQAPTARPIGVAEQATHYSELEEVVERALSELAFRPTPLEPADFAMWSERIRALRGQIAEARNLNFLNDKEARTLMRGLREIITDLGLRRSTDAMSAIASISRPTDTPLLGTPVPPHE
jgi:TRAP-type uncharacterized transport system substrate-binding protein